MEHENDADLLSARTLVAERYAIFYRRHVDAVLAFYASRGLDAESAADLTAETFAAAYVARRRFRRRGDEASARAWLLTIAARRQVDATRRWSREQRAIDRLKLERPPLTADDAATFESEGVEQVLEELPPHHRDALRHRVIEELPYEEVARRGGSSEPAARQRVRRALTEMKTRLEDR